ncbi:hypothetical protein [Xanthocytophaga agilis]|uniref:Uncharacterized protein n=1 Tax=Xanthocytophaga agilis TaxID=3048010 RepID=A0AAE3RBI2_9BACT|nr:hypothetical protein [Xanthocytophaga agilis]MDJ1505180.1 hypothetical protein [Xanthocytophaga agilis]
MKLFIFIILLSFLSQVGWGQTKGEIRNLLEKDSIHMLVSKYGETEAIRKLMHYAEYEFNPQKDAWYDLQDVDSVLVELMVSTHYTSMRMQAFYWIWLIVTKQTQRVKDKYLGLLIDRRDSLILYDLVRDKSKSNFALVKRWNNSENELSKAYKS